MDITGDDGPTGQLSYSRAAPHLGAKLQVQKLVSLMDQQYNPWGGSYSNQTQGTDV